MTLHSSDKILTISGWKVGFQKVEFTKMLQRELGLSLSAAKNITDRVLANERIDLPLGNADTKRVVDAALELGAIVLADDLEGACQ
jgi:hypothetical protein